MEFLNQTMFALRGPTGQPQTASDTIGKLADRLGPSTLLADRRAAVLTLKGLSRKHSEEVAARCLQGLLSVLATDASIDADIGRAALETLFTLCRTDEQHDLGLQHSDSIIAATDSVHTIFSLIQDEDYYVRYEALRLLVALLQNRRQAVQAQFLKAPSGAAGLIHALEDRREIIRNEALLVTRLLITQSADIQKVFAFEGAFDRLFTIITEEHGLDGGAIVLEALGCVDALLRFNSSNQSFFRETPYPPILCTLLGYPPALPHTEAPPQTFALQFWDDNKTANAGLAVGLIGMLANAKGGSPQEFAAFTRCLVEIGLASNAPTLIKTQALRLLPTNDEVPLSALILTAYVPVPDTNGEEWDRLEPASALDAIVELVLHGEYNGVIGGAAPTKHALELRAAALYVFEHFVRGEEMKLAIIRAMLPSEDGTTPPLTPLLAALIAPPATPPDLASVTSTQMAALLFTHLLRGSPDAKAIARTIVPSPLGSGTQGGSGSFFVPADHGSAPAPPPPAEDDDEPPQSLLQILAEHLSLAFLARRRTETSEHEAREWDRLVAGYVCLLTQWLWEEPGSVRDFIEAGALGMLVEPINGTDERDVLVPALCVFLLGVVYEFNREPGEATRATIHPILTRLGVDTLVGRMARLREDERFKAVSPDSIVLPAVASTTGAERRDESEVWFDWPFVDFWKSNYYTIQKGIATDPNSLSSSSSAGAESAMLIASLRQVISQQAQEIESLQGQLKGATATASGHTSEIDALRAEITSLRAQIAEQASKPPAPPPAATKNNQAEIEALAKQLENIKIEAKEADERRKETEKEQEDLLVLLDELNAKRRRDKIRMREKGMEVSEDEEEEDDEDDEDDE